MNTTEKNFDSFFNMLAAQQYKQLRAELSEMNEVDIAAFIEQVIDRIAEKKAALVFRMLPKEMAAAVFAEFSPDTQKYIINSITDSELKNIIEDLFVDDVVDMLEELPANVVKRVLKNANPDTRALINQFLKYDENSVGSIMTAEFIDLNKNMTVEQAFMKIRRTAFDRETVYTCYVTDAARHLEGVVSVKTLFVSDDHAKIEDIFDTDVISTTTSDDREVAVGLFSKYGLLSLPVVDNENRLVGIVTVDDALDVITEEATEDFHKMAAITPTSKPYRKTSVFELWKSRIPWLLLLMVSATFTGMIITNFENALAAYVVLTSFIPMLMDTGGNCGSQSSTTVIRGIALNEIQFHDIFYVLWKEMRVALLCGATLCLCNFAKVLLFDKVTLAVALVVCLTLFFTTVIAKLVGCTLPLLAKKAGFDPAVMASPFITTIVDALSLLIYFGIAHRLLHI